MGVSFSSLPRTDVVIEANASQGPLEVWRHTVGQGGINPLPLPERVVEGAHKLGPRLIRVFLQEHFDIYPEHGRLNWSTLDPFMDSLARTGAKVVAAITLKPKALFPTVDQRTWRPTDWGEWQRVIFELAKRYSVDKPIVTYWEVGNETDIGESGGSPYLIQEARDYFEYYRMTIEPVLKAFPAAKVGGPASASIDNEPLPGLVRLCRESGTRLDFISWHLYNDDPMRHSSGVEKAKRVLAGFPGGRPEMLVTEWNKMFDPVSSEDLAFEPRRAANVAACILSMLEAGLDWSFYYHLWDQTFYRRPFESFFSANGLRLMDEHWNQVPHRFGLFGVSGEVRPQYFVYQMLGRMGEERIPATSAEPDLRVLAGRSDSAVSALIANFGPEQSRDMMVTTRFAGLRACRKLLKAYRVDASRRWFSETLEQLPLEQREVDASSDFRCSFYCPADSVLMVTLQDV